MPDYITLSVSLENAVPIKDGINFCFGLNGLTNADLGLGAALT